MNIKTIVQSIYYLLDNTNKSLDKLSILKLVFFADRYHIRKYARTITNDTYYAMQYGPVASNVKKVSNNDIDISIKELAMTIKKIVDYKGELYFNDTKPDGTMIKLTNPSKLNNLGWKYKVELTDGIKMINNMPTLIKSLSSVLYNLFNNAHHSIFGVGELFYRNNIR